MRFIQDCKFFVDAALTYPHRTIHQNSAEYKGQLRLFYKYSFVYQNIGGMYLLTRLWQKIKAKSPVCRI